MLRPTTRFLPEIAVLRSAGVRVVVGIGKASAGQVCDRTSRALAAPRVSTQLGDAVPRQVISRPPRLVNIVL